MTHAGFIDSEALAQSLESLAERPADGGLMGALEQVIGASRELFDATGAGFMMVDDSSALTVVLATDEPGRLLERRQQETGEGPCVDALAFDRIVATSDLATDARWPVLGPELPAAGVRAVLGVPIRIGGLPVGSLNVYRNQPSGWGETEHSALEAYSGLAGRLLATALQAREHEQLAEQLQHALNHRVVIERAVGVIMAREGINAVAAFNRLRLQARSAQRRVADVAAELLSAFPGNP